MTADEPSTGSFSAWLERTASGLGYRNDSALARALGVEQSTISRWKRNAKPSIEHLTKVSGLFGMELLPLLVLAGHVPPDAVPGNVSLDRPPVLTAGDRIIIDAGMPEPVQEALSRFWAVRLQEEQHRLAALCDHLAQNQGAAKVPADAQISAVRLAETELPAHIATLLAESRQAFSSRRRPARAGA